MSVETYKAIYAAQAAAVPNWEQYGHSNHGSPVTTPLLAFTLPRAMRVIDVGCGHNEFAKSLRAGGINAVGADPACPGADIQAGFAELSESAERFDVATAFDVMEHLAPSEVDLALACLKRLAPRFVLTIAYSPSVRSVNGKNLHETVEPEYWWLRKLHKLDARMTKFGPRTIVGAWLDTTGNWTLDKIGERFLHEPNA